MEKKKVDVLEQMQNMTIDLNSKALIEKAEKDGVETMYKRKLGYKVTMLDSVYKVFAVETVVWDHVESVQKLQEDFVVLMNIQ